MHTIALVSQKGGAGKTTLAVHLATEATRRGLRAILIDLDPQASAGLWGDKREAASHGPPPSSANSPGSSRSR